MSTVEPSTSLAQSVSSNAPRLAPVGLIAMLTYFAADMVRASGPMEDFGFTTGLTKAAIISFSMYLLPGVFVAVLLSLRIKFDGARIATLRAAMMAVGLLLVLRLIVQAMGISGSLVIGIVTVAISIAALLLAVTVVSAYFSATHIVVGIFSGLLVLLCSLEIFQTWDPIWHSDLGSWAWVIAMCVVTLALAWITMQQCTFPRNPPSRRIWILGPLLAVGTMTFLNPAFLASQSGLSLSMSIMALALTTFVTLIGVLVIRTRPHAHSTYTTGWILSAGVFVVAIAAAYALPGLPSAIAVLVALIALAPVLLRDVSQPGVEWSSSIRFILRQMVIAFITGLSIVLTQLLFQLDYDVPLPFPNLLLPTAAALSIALAGVYRHRNVQPSESTQSVTAPAGRALIGGVCAVMAAGIVVYSLNTMESPEVDAVAPNNFVLLDWNLHYGVSNGPGIELEEIARTIEDSRASFVTLQEVNRGWVYGSGTDMATWLSKRLGMSYAWSSAADGQFGNLVLSSYKLSSVKTIALPYGQGPQKRSAICATVITGDRPVSIVSVHLQHRDENTPTRTQQISTLLSKLPTGATIIGGDFNAHPDGQEYTTVTSAGLISAQDAAGDPAAFTFSSDNPQERIDYIFGRLVTFSSMRIGTSQASDHLPLLTSVAVD